MRFIRPLVVCAAVAWCSSATGQDITGTVTVKKQLTRPSVTAPVSVYQRGAVVKVSKGSNADPLAFERSRVVIYLEGPTPASSETSNHPSPQIQQIDRRFTPDLVVVPIGSTVSFPNMDPIFHNIYSLSKPKSFDLGSYDKGENRNVTFPKPGIVEIYCHLHPNMAATVVVTPNRWYARPDRNGQYRIPAVPPGEYTLVAWHKSAGFFRQTVKIEDGHEAVADFFIPIDIDPKSDAELKHEVGQNGSFR